MSSRNCFYCGTVLTHGKKGKSHRRATNDHIVPRLEGGSNSHTNKVKCCQSCNSKKGSLSLEEFRVVMAMRHGLLPVGNMNVSYQFWGEKVEASTING
jgi:HNH endonuclease